MSPAGRVFILGAGASAFAGYPLAKDLLQFLQRDPTLVAKTKEVASALFAKIQSAATTLERETKQQTNLELLLTHLDLWGNACNLKEANGEWTESDRMSINRVIAEQFLWHQHKIQRRLSSQKASNLDIYSDPARVQAVVDAWAQMVQDGDTLISFNWDLLHESALWRAKKWSYVDGYGFTIRSPSLNEPRTRIRILKLHGSVNWMQDSESEEVPEVEFAQHFFFGATPPPREFPPKGAALDRGRKLVLPTYLKDVSKNNALLAVWCCAQETLRHAREVYVIGYSLNPADHPARLLFATELRRNRDIQKISILGPSAGDWRSFLNQLGIKLDHIPRRFEDWILSQAA